MPRPLDAANDDDDLDDDLGVMFIDDGMSDEELLLRHRRFQSGRPGGGRAGSLPGPGAGPAAGGGRPAARRVAPSEDGNSDDLDRGRRRSHAFASTSGRSASAGSAGSGNAGSGWMPQQGRAGGRASAPPRSQTPRLLQLRRRMQAATKARWGTVRGGSCHPAS